MRTVSSITRKGAACMYSCPACGLPGVERRPTCSCGADLSLLIRLDCLADAWFNSALDAFSAGAPGRAVEWLSACCAARPSDTTALRALAKAWAHLARFEEARAAL